MFVPAHHYDNSEYVTAPPIVAFAGFRRVNLNRVALEEGEEQEVGLLLNPVSLETLQRKRMTSTVRR